MRAVIQNLAPDSDCIHIEHNGVVISVWKDEDGRTCVDVTDNVEGTDAEFVDFELVERGNDKDED